MAVSRTATPLFLIFLVVVFSCSYCIHAFHLPLRHNYPNIGHEKRKAWFSSVDFQKIGEQDRWRATRTSSASSSQEQEEGKKAMAPDEEIMEALIATEWADLEAFSNQHYKYLIHPQFYMKLADRIYELPTQEEQDEAAAKATKIWNRLLKILESAETMRTTTAEKLEKMVAQAAEDDGAFLFPLAPDRVEVKPPFRPPSLPPSLPPFLAPIQFPSLLYFVPLSPLCHAFFFDARSILSNVRRHVSPGVRC
ncbi:hypothetical protein Naga_100648g1 [Nannochloropsis gaditana]|uniref:Uncharacterized protein n=1 Tax=Nannochloropsis gaditana TaxID=72520 RepID=W7TF54_9STRA|nr:hypothetical protein Naga_100648g1 [Nannochloropsis gaditana]